MTSFARAQERHDAAREIHPEYWDTTEIVYCDGPCNGTGKVRAEDGILDDCPLCGGLGKEER